VRGEHKLGEGKHYMLGGGTHNKLGEGERKVRLGQDSLPNSHFRSGNERKVGTLFYPHPAKGTLRPLTKFAAKVQKIF
jgi:hypothetical protein